MAPQQEENQKKHVDFLTQFRRSPFYEKYDYIIEATVGQDNNGEYQMRKEACKNITRYDFKKTPQLLCQFISKVATVYA